MILKKSFAVCLAVIMLCSSFIKDNNKKKVVFFGDSITEAAVKEDGYISQIQKMAGASDYDLIGAGVSGNKVYDLYLRMDSDVLSKSPDIVVIYVGINDVWHKRSAGTGTDANKYEAFYRAIIKKLKAQNIQVIVCTPSVIGEYNNCTNPLDGELNQYSEIVRKIAKSESLPVVDLRNVFQNYLQKNNPENKYQGILTVDGVHLNNNGNKLVADEMWKAIKTLK